MQSLVREYKISLKYIEQPKTIPALRFSAKGLPTGRVWQWMGRGELEGWLYFQHIDTHLRGSQVRRR